mmetsp:Transcript_42659/g.40963  ORF Transcript_42659/g.40963 Transcript_42659/m.40963 type:complete len:254 (+) Transcript_42659:121-882(+)
MEKLKDLENEQKLKKRITLKLSTTPSLSGTLGGATTDSPSKKILVGEFDEMKEDEDDLEKEVAPFPGDDMLLSRDTSKLDDLEEKREDNIDMDYVTHITGMEDPFPDHHDEHEEMRELTISKTEQDERRKEEEEQQRLRSQVKFPYLPPLQNRLYTLVLDLDETLIHFECDEDDDDNEDSGYYLIRPGAIKFLNELSKYYELVIFTAAMPDYADWIMDNVDRQKIVKYRLYRQHTTPHEDYAIKDLRNLGRDL